MRKSFIPFVMINILMTVPAWAQWKEGGKALLGSTSRVASIAMNVEKQAIQNMGISLAPTIPVGVSLQEPWLRSIFQARETTTELTNLFSGTVFQTEYNGKREVYIAVAAHALHGGSKVLHRNFTADIYVGDGKFRPVRAQIIQASAPSMLDIAIGKVLEGEEDLVPLTISHKAFGVGDVAISYGYAGKSLVVIPTRRFLSETPLCIRTTIPYPREERMGFCGGALVDDEGNLLGIHTGSSYPSANERDDIGHATDAALLETLVKAAHNNGEGTFPLILGGQKILDMPVMGYISYIRLFDERGKQLWQCGFESKFGYDQVNEAISIFSPRYIELTTRRVHWEGDYLREIRASRDKSRRTYQYDFLERKIIRESKPKE